LILNSFELGILIICCLPIFAVLNYILGYSLSIEIINLDSPLIM